MKLLTVITSPPSATLLIMNALPSSPSWCFSPGFLHLLYWILLPNPITVNICTASLSYWVTVPPGTFGNNNPSWLDMSLCCFCITAILKGWGSLRFSCSLMRLGAHTLISCFYFSLSKSCSVRIYLIVSSPILEKNCYRVVESILINIYASIRQVMERCIVGVITRCKKTDFRADHERMRCSGLYAKLHQTLIEDHKSPIRRCVFMEMHSQWCMDITYCKHNYLHELSSIKAGTITDTLKSGKRKQLTQYNK